MHGLSIFLIHRFTIYSLMGVRLLMRTIGIVADCSVGTQVLCV